MMWMLGCLGKGVLGLETEGGRTLLVVGVLMGSWDDVGVVLG